MTKASRKNIILDQIPPIYYLFCFYKNKKNKMQALINSENEVNAMKLPYALKLGFKVY